VCGPARASPHLTPLPPLLPHPSPRAANANARQTYAIRFKQPTLALEFAEAYKKAQLANEKAIMPSLPAKPVGSAGGDAEGLAASASGSSGGGGGSGGNPAGGAAESGAAAMPATAAAGGARAGSSGGGSSAAAGSGAGSGSGSSSAGSSEGSSGSGSSSSGSSPVVLSLAAVCTLGALGAAAYYFAPEAQRSKVREALKAAQASIVKGLASVTALAAKK
jgi:hypothetical protein